MSNTEMIKPRYMSTYGTAFYSGLTVEDLRLMREHGVGPTYIKICNEIRYDCKDMDKWMEDRKISIDEEDQQFEALCHRLHEDIE